MTSSRKQTYFGIEQLMVQASTVGRFRVQCPQCNAFYRCKLEDYDASAINADGTLSIAIRPPCNHFFMVFLDAKLNARSTQIIQDAKVDITLIRTDPNHLLEKEKALLERHNQAVANNDYMHIDEIWSELKKLRKEITILGLD